MEAPNLSQNFEEHKAEKNTASSGMEIDVTDNENKNKSEEVVSREPPSISSDDLHDSQTIIESKQTNEEIQEQTSNCGETINSSKQNKRLVNFLCSMLVI